MRWWWGTNRPGGVYYAGRVHIVAPEDPATGMCGLPVTDLWEQRPPTPEHLCPDCCVRAVAASYPPSPTASALLRPTVGRHQLADDDWFSTPADNQAEQTAVLPVLRDDDSA